MSAPKLAWRSLWRHSRRTAFSMLAAGLGLFLALAFVGLTDGMVEDANERVDRTGLGHLQINAAGFREEQDPSKLLAAPAALLKRLTFPEGTKVSARVLTPGLVTSAWGSRGVDVLGVDPAAEAGVSEAIRDLVEGAPLAADDARGVLVGKKLAKRLKLQVGTKLRLTVQRPDGELGAELFRVRGVFGGVAPSMGEHLVYVTSGAAQQLLGIGDAVHQVVVFLPDGRQADALAPGLRAQAGPGVEVLPLSEFLPVWKSMQRMIDLMIFALVLVVYLLVGLGILNVMLMSILERTQEFGVLMALGTRPRQVVAQVLWEGVWIATIAVAVGLVLGLALNAWGSTHGLIDYSEGFGEVYEMSGVAMSMKLKSAFSVPRALETAALVWVLTVLVGVYPAYHVSKLRPADALRKA